MSVIYDYLLDCFRINKNSSAGSGSGSGQDGAYLEPRVEALETAVGDVETVANAIIGEPEE